MTIRGETWKPAAKGTHCSGFIGYHWIGTIGLDWSLNSDEQGKTGMGRAGSNSTGQGWAGQRQVYSAALHFMYDFMLRRTLYYLVASIASLSAECLVS